MEAQKTEQSQVVILCQCSIGKYTDFFLFNKTQILECLVLSKDYSSSKDSSDCLVYVWYLPILHKTDLCMQNFRATEVPHSTIPISILSTSYHPDIVVFNSQVPSIALLCPLHGLYVQYTQSARSWNKSKVEYLSKVKGIKLL